MNRILINIGCLELICTGLKWVYQVSHSVYRPRYFQPDTCSKAEHKTSILATVMFKKWGQQYFPLCSSTFHFFRFTWTTRESQFLHVLSVHSGGVFEIYIALERNLRFYRVFRYFSSLILNFSIYRYGRMTLFLSLGIIHSSQCSTSRAPAHYFVYYVMYGFNWQMYIGRF